MRLTKIDVDIADVAASGIAAANDSSGATIVLDGALTSGGTFTSADGLGRQIAITDTATVDQSGATFTIAGTNANGGGISEDVVGPTAAGTVTSTEYFYTITSITITSPAVGGTVNVGTTQLAETKVVPVNWIESDGCTVAIMGSVGTYQVDIQETFDNILQDGVTNANFWAKQADKTADGAFTMTPRATGVKITTDSYTNGAEFQMHVLSSVSN